MSALCSASYFRPRHQPKNDFRRMNGESIFGEDGLRRFGGHSWRVSGARHLARASVHLLAIMALARRATASVLRYIGDAPINCVAAEYKALQREKKPEKMQALDPSSAPMA